VLGVGSIEGHVCPFPLDGSLECGCVRVVRANARAYRISSASLDNAS
jgi:hypothetical protein